MTKTKTGKLGSMTMKFSIEKKLRLGFFKTGLGKNSFFGLREVKTCCLRLGGVIPHFSYLSKLSCSAPLSIGVESTAYTAPVWPALWAPAMLSLVGQFLSVVNGIF